MAAQMEVIPVFRIHQAAEAAPERWVVFRQAVQLQALAALALNGLQFPVLTTQAAAAAGLTTQAAAALLGQVVLEVVALAG